MLKDCTSHISATVQLRITVRTLLEPKPDSRPNGCPMKEIDRRSKC